jgi:flagellar biogenesis protein FliO
MVALAVALAISVAQETPVPLEGLDEYTVLNARETAAAPVAPAVKVESKRVMDRPEPGPGLAGVVGWTGAVLALLLGGFVLLRRFAVRSRLLGGGGLIDVLARRAVGQKQEIFVVSIGPKVLVVGATRDRLSTLGEFSGAEGAAVRADALGIKEGPSRASFRASLDAGMRDVTPAPDAAYASMAEELAEIGKTVRGWKA